MAYGQRSDFSGSNYPLFSGFFSVSKLPGARRSEKRKHGTKKTYRSARRAGKRNVRGRKKGKYRANSTRRTGKIYYARKTGQPYVILSNGRAKFIKGRRHK